MSGQGLKIHSVYGGEDMTRITEQIRLYLTGWRSYFRLAQTPQTFKDLGSWIRHRSRAIQHKQWGIGTIDCSRARSFGATREMASKIAGGAGR